MKEKELYGIWRKYINKNVYRVTSDEYTKDILKNGLNPKNDPFTKIRPELEKLFELVLKLEKRGFVITLDWISKKPTGSYSVLVSRDDLDAPFIDFTPYWFDALKFKRQWKGGAIVTNTKELCEGVLNLGAKLSENEKKHIDFLLKWTVQKSRFKNRIIIVKGSSKYFESAHFQHHLGKGAGEKQRYWVSPYGSFMHFKNVIKNHGIEKYLPFFKEEKVGHLRLTKKVPTKEIYKIV